jgi:ribonuclease P protein component
LADPALDSLRTGFITTKRSGKAHDRNLLRRRFRVLVQTHAPQFPEIRRFIVTIARPGAGQATFAELEADWLRQARRLGLLPRPNEKP